jgi:alpha-glucosidase
LPEALEIPEDQIQDPQYLRNHKVDKGRDGCRVPLPWSIEGASFGFGSGGAHLPQPEFFGELSIDAQSGVAGSPLEIFKKALTLRKDLVTTEELTWHESGHSDLLHFSRPNGWHCLTNFGQEAVSLPSGLELIHSSQPLQGGEIAGATTVWLRG